MITEHYKRHGGFTLVELLVVVAIMGVLAVVAVPSFYTWATNIKYKDAAWGVASQIKLGRQMAASNNLEYRVELDVDGERYTLSEGNASSGSTSWNAVRSWTYLEEEVAWATGAACGGTADMNILLYPNGSADAAVVCVKDGSGNLRIKVNVNDTSGRVYME